MAHLAGNTGQVLAPGTATGIANWELTYSSILIPSTDFADAGIRTMIWAGSEWAGSFDGPKDGIALVLGTAPVALQLKESGAAGQLWTGSAFISNFTDSVKFDGIVQYSYSFEGTGILTPATA